MDPKEIERLYHKYFDTLYKICFLYMKNEDDSLDVVQETFIKLIKSNFKVQSEEKTNNVSNNEIKKVEPPIKPKPPVKK